MGDSFNMKGTFISLIGLPLRWTHTTLIIFVSFSTLFIVWYIFYIDYYILMGCVISFPDFIVGIL